MKYLFCLMFLMSGCATVSEYYLGCVDGVKKLSPLVLNDSNVKQGCGELNQERNRYKANQMISTMVR